MGGYLMQTQKTNDVFLEILGKHKKEQELIDKERVDKLSKLKQKQIKLKKTKQDMKQYKKQKLKILLGFSADKEDKKPCT